MVLVAIVAVTVVAAPLAGSVRGSSSVLRRSQASRTQPGSTLCHDCVNPQRPSSAQGAAQFTKRKKNNDEEGWKAGDQKLSHIRAVIDDGSATAVGGELKAVELLFWALPKAAP